MQIAFLVSLVVLGATACSHETSENSEAGQATSHLKIGSTTSGNVAQIEIKLSSGKSHTLQVERDSTVAVGAQAIRVEQVAQLGESTVIVVDTYPSMPGGASYCQAGEEQFLRVVSTASNPFRETYSLKTASCRDNLELASPGIEWQPESSSLLIHWLQGPGLTGKPEQLRIQIGSDGEVIEKANINFGSTSESR